jgi:hypothetical protein
MMLVSRPDLAVADLLSQLRSYVVGHPGLLLTGVYLQTSAVGVCYDRALFGAFGVNIFHWAEANDFLLAALTDTTVLVQTVVTIAVALFVLLGPIPRREQSSGTQQRRVPYFTLMMAFLLPALVYTVAVPWAFATYRADQIKSGGVIALTIECGNTTYEDVHLIGTTEKHVFFYDLVSGQTHIAPVARASLVVDETFSDPLR